MKIVAIFALLVMPGLALAQAGAPSGVVTGPSRNFSQDRDTPRNLTAAPVGTAKDRVERVQRQQRQNQNITGTGRAVAAPPAPTPVAAARPAAPAAATPAARPATPPAAAAPAATAPAAGARPATVTPPGAPRPGATMLAAPDAVRSGQAVPSMVGQSTGPARGAASGATPASR
jgi:hypothetical protein